MAKNKLTETTHSFCHMCTGKLIFLKSTAIFYKKTLKHVSVFYDFTGTINYWFKIKPIRTHILS